MTTVDVADSTKANDSIAVVEALLKTAIEGAAALGSSKGHIEDQQKFISKLVDAMKSGIGALVMRTWKRHPPVFRRCKFNSNLAHNLCLLPIKRHK